MFDQEGGDIMKKVTKTWLIIAASLVLVGGILFVGVMSMLKWDFKKLSTVQYETSEYELEEEYSKISIITNTADITLVPSEKTKSFVVCYEESKEKHVVKVEDDILKIEVSNKKKWYDYIGIQYGTAKITVEIPKKQYEQLSIKESTGDILIENVTVNAMDLTVSTGEVKVKSVACKGDVNVRVTTGKTKMTDVNCKNLYSDGNTGDIILKNVVAANSFKIERSTGDLKMESCDATTLSIKTNTGNVTGSLLTGKSFVTQTSTGTIQVPETTGGKCKISTSTGDIKITIQ